MNTANRLCSLAWLQQQFYEAMQAAASTTTTTTRNSMSDETEMHINVDAEITEKAATGEVMACPITAIGLRYDHELKVDPDLFSAMFHGERRFELRFDDRGFLKGQILWLRETKHPSRAMRHGAPLEYTGNWLQAEVTYLMRGPVFGLAEGWVIMSLKAITLHSSIFLEDNVAEQGMSPKD